MTKIIAIALVLFLPFAAFASGEIDVLKYTTVCLERAMVFGRHPDSDYAEFLAVPNLDLGRYSAVYRSAFGVIEISWDYKITKITLLLPINLDDKFSESWNSDIITIATSVLEHPSNYSSESMIKENLLKQATKTRNMVDNILELIKTAPERIASEDGVMLFVSNGWEYVARGQIERIVSDDGSVSFEYALNRFNLIIKPVAGE